MPTDKERIDFLQKILCDNGTYTGKCIFRKSTTGRGFRLHETRWKGSSEDVREQIDLAMERYEDDPERPKNE